MTSESTPAPQITQMAMDIQREAMAAKNGTLVLPNYIFEGKIKTGERKGEPDGTYHIDFVKYSDAMKKELNAIRFLKQLYIYNKDCAYFMTNINQIETSIRDTIKKYAVDDRLSTVERETLIHLNSMGCEIRYPFTGTKGAINVLNGSLDIQSGIITPTTGANLYDYRIETEYRVFNEGTPELYAFLDQYGTREPIDVLAKAIWQRAFNDVLKELTVFVGPKDCGKTTLAELIQSTIDGDINSHRCVSRSLLHELLMRFGFAGLEGKVINYGDDLPDMYIKNTSRINALVGSTNLRVEKKGIDQYDTNITTYFLFSCNNLPPLDDDDNIIWSKIHLVEFNKPVCNKKIPREELFTKTLKEQLLFRAVELARSWIITPYTNNQTADEVRMKWQESSTDIESYMVECLEFDPTSSVSLEDIKFNYESWCIVNNKKRYIKYLNKKLQPYFRRQNMQNVYTVKINKPLAMREKSSAQNHIPK